MQREETVSELRDGHKLLNFLKWLSDRGFELSKRRQLSCGEWVWIPITDTVYTVEKEDMVKAYMSDKREPQN